MQQQELQIPAGTLSSPTQPAPVVPDHPSKPCCAWLWAWGSDTPELTWPWFWPCAHRQRTASLLYQMQEVSSLLCHQCPLGSRRRPEEPWAHYTALVQFILIFCCPFKRNHCPTHWHLLSKHVRNPFPCQSLYFPSLNKTTSKWKTSTLHPWTIPKQLKAGDWPKLLPCLRSWMPGSETCHCYILIKTRQDLGFYCQVPKKI